jgi:malonyl-CoA/methylmalonyl-CoA synthetase
VAQIAFRAGSQHVFTLGQAGREPDAGSLLMRAAPHADEFATVARAGTDLAAILYTSGTTGRSKGAMLSHANLASNAQVLRQYWHWQAGDVLLHALPIFHIHGLFVALHGALLNGSKTIFLPRFDAAAVMRQLPRATVFMGVPTYYVRLLAAPGFKRELCANMRLFISGSAPLAIDTFTAFQQQTGHTILERYGMSETGMLTSNPYTGARLAGTVGQPLPGVSVRVVDADGSTPCGVGMPGAIEVSGANVFQGYWRMPEKTATEFTADGYFRTGDVGQWNDAGYLSIVGRGKDLIISGGYNIYPKEIELLLDTIDGVLESAVIGVADTDYGEAVAAVVIPRIGATLDGAAIIEHLRQRIAHFKVPKQLFFEDALPRNAMGKVQKNVLRQRYGTAPTPRKPDSP